MITLSLIFGIFSLAIYLLIFILKQKINEDAYTIFNLSLILLFFLIIFVFLSLRYSYSNPSLPHYDVNVEINETRKIEKNKMEDLSKELGKIS